MTDRSVSSNERCYFFGEGRGQCLKPAYHVLAVQKQQRIHTCEEDGHLLDVALTGLSAVREAERSRESAPETSGCPDCAESEGEARRANVMQDKLSAEWTAMRLALLGLVDATEDTLRSHPETDCCAVTRKRCAEARKALAATAGGADR